MNPLPFHSNALPAKSAFACVRCSERKVKCDKQIPCNACVRHSAQCIFRPPKPAQRKRKLIKYELMEERLKNYEALLREKGIDLDHVDDRSVNERQSESGRSNPSGTVWQMPTPPSTVSGPQGTLFKPMILQGPEGTKLVDNSLWSRVAEEIHDAEDGPEEDSANDTSDDTAVDDGFAYVLGLKTSRTTFSHPPANVIHRLWRTFVENVNPLTKIVHVPSLQPAIEKAASHVESIPKGFEALMFSIYSMAVCSIQDEECKGIAGETRAMLLPYYISATKAALARARFMSSTSMVVLQALVLHILSIRDDEEPRAVWSLIGVAIRIAEGMGMRLDGDLLGLSPFETELHRRIWWQLKMHEFRAAELSGQAKFRNFELDETTPKKPANVNDSDLYPTMKRAPVESTRPTEMLWIVFRTDLASFANSQRVKMQKDNKATFSTEEYTAMDDLKIKDEFIKKLEDMIETKYVRFCDPTQPLQFLTLLVARLSTNLIRFIAHHPRRWAKLDQVPASEQEFVWGVVIQLLEQHNMMQSSPQLRHFAWNVPYFIQWHAVIHVLDTLRADPLRPDAAKAWQLIDTLYENNLEMLLSTKRPISIAIGNLCWKAFSARQAAITKENERRLDPPHYIIRLREERGAAKARKEAAIDRSKGPGDSYHEKRSAITNNDNALSGAAPSSADALLEAQPQPYSIAQPVANLDQGNILTGDDSFWLNEALDENIFANGPEMMNLDTDTILNPSGSWLDQSNSEHIDWAQWDVWLGNVNPKTQGMNAGTG
ncbi:MAG: hypothetical protein L6R41_005064 [Letrouitia leprolyta]|nr:MAG: hypothetical protein L6R41_005064 [Letrouitia leprolyta]